MIMVSICNICRFLFFRRRRKFSFLFKSKRRHFCNKKTIAVIFALMFLFLMVIFIGVLYFYSFYCSFEEVKKAVETICDKYSRNETTGNLCVQLCSNEFFPINCISNHLGKDIVFKASYKRKGIIIKSSHLNINSIDEIFWKNGTGIKHYPSISMFHDMLTYSVIKNLDLNNNEKYDIDFINILWPKNDKYLNISALTESELQNLMAVLWNLVQQPEFLLLKYYEKENLFPKILGNCGNFYMEEYIEPLENFFLLFYPSWRNEFPLRAKIALSILNYLEQLEKRFPDLHLCDMKIGHFGLAADGTVRMLDADMVFPEKNLLQNMLLTGNCTEDIDCSFIDCLGYCNTTLKQCLPIVGNNNFQRVCSNIFLGKFAPQYLGLLGLPPKNVQPLLQSLLKHCSAHMEKNFEIKIKNDLKTLLQSYLY